MVMSQCPYHSRNFGRVDGDGNEIRLPLILCGIIMAY